MGAVTPGVVAALDLRGRRGKQGTQRLKRRMVQKRGGTSEVVLVYQADVSDDIQTNRKSRRKASPGVTGLERVALIL